jgi:hypothetical protein
MANGQPLEKGPSKEELDLLNKAVSWAAIQDASQGGVTCPFCSKDFRLNEDTNPDPAKLRSHIRTEHSSRVLMAWQADDINVDVRAEDDDEMGLIERLSLVDEYDKTDFLYVDPRIKEQARANGDELRWVAPRNMTRMKAMGAELVTVKSGDDAVTMQTGGDGSAQANEMKLFRIPARLAYQRREIKTRRAQTEMTTRKEEADIQGDAQAKVVYDRLIKDNVDPVKARQVANAIAGREDSGDWRGKDAGAHVGVNISR